MPNAMTQTVLNERQETPRWQVRLFALLAVLVLAAVAIERFQYIHEIGMWGWNDPEEYYYNAVHFPTLGNPPHFRVQPAAHMVHFAFIKVFGDTDYALKIANGSFDVACSVLLLALGFRVCRNLWVSLLLTCLYAFTPQVVYFARSELPHSITAFWGLLTFWLFWEYLDAAPTRRPTAFVVGAGFTSAMAVMTHLAMAALPLACLIAIYCAPAPSPAGQRRILRLVRPEALYYAGACAGVTALFILMLPLAELTVYLERVYKALFLSEVNVIWRFTRKTQLDSLGYSINRLEAGVLLLLVGMRWLGDTSTEPIARIDPGSTVTGLLFPMTIGLFLLANRKRPKRFNPGHLLLLLVLALAAGTGFLCGTFHLGDSRYLLNVYPLFLLALLWWLSRSCACTLGPRYGTWAAAAVLLLIYAAQPHVYPFDPVLRQPLCVGKEIHNAIGGRVDDNNRILILPFAIPVEAEAYMTDYHLFGENALRVRDMPHTGESLAQMSRAQRIRFAYVSSYVQSYSGWEGTRDGQFMPDIPNPDFYGRTDSIIELGEGIKEWLIEEKRLIDDFLVERKGVPILSTDYGMVYELTDDRPPAAGVP